LDFVGEFATRAGKIRRFEAHPYVDGDSLSEHHHRLQRLLVCIAPYLKEEFPKEKDLIEDISLILSLHDDDEIMVGYDITTQLKNHDASFDGEVRDFKKAVSRLSKKSLDFMTERFRSFRTRDSRVAKIAKALDNLAGNQVLIEQKFALINPNPSKFTIEYAEKVKGASKTTDALIDAQVSQIVEYRKYLKAHPKEVERLIDARLPISDPKERKRVIAKARKLLEINVLTHVLNLSQTLVPLDKLE
jgi:5'-deoxynucleotidase YfbR-like HD superfamily hydrolase